MATIETLNDASPYMQGNFAPVQTEHTAADLEVTGQVPADLEGRLLRNGPNPVGHVDMKSHHWFLGDGMVHGIRLAGGEAHWYRNRYVGSAAIARELGRTFPEPVTAEGGPNTNVIGHNGRTYAIVEAGTKPVELTYELETVGTNGFEHSLLNGYTAHPKYDPLTGEMHAIAYSPAELLDKVQYVVVGPDGSVTKTIPVTVPGMPMIHDMGLTQKYAVVLDLPVAVDLELALGGSSFPVRWFDDYDARIGLLPRTVTTGEEADAEIIWCSIDPCFAFHPLNSYDTPDGKVVIDICRYDKLFDADRNGPFRDSLPQLERWTVNPATNSVSRDIIDERFQEFPRVAGVALNAPHRFGYTTSVGDSESQWAFGETIKHDLTNRTSEVHDHGATRQAGEPVFVSRADSSGEDDGWILTMVYDAATDKSDLVILDAADITSDPVATVHLPTRVPNGFHGNWVRDSVTPPS